MKKTIKLFGIIAFVAVIGFLAVGCEIDNNENNDSEMLDGAWDRGDIVVTFSNGIGVFTQINSGSGWIPVLNNGKIKIGDQKFRNLKKSGNLQWSCQERTFDANTQNSTGWADCTITLSSNGQTLTAYTPSATSSTSTYTKEY